MIEAIKVCTYSTARRMILSIPCPILALQYHQAREQNRGVWSAVPGRCPLPWEIICWISGSFIKNIVNIIGSLSDKTVEWQDGRVVIPSSQSAPI